MTPALVALLEQLAPRRREAATALITAGAWGEPPTYSDVARSLGVHLGTVHQHLRWIRRVHPDVYAAIMAERRAQLAVRHTHAQQRAASHTAAWRRRRRNWTYRQRFGCWPWEARGTGRQVGAGLRGTDAASLRREIEQTLRTALGSSYSLYQQRAAQE